MAKKVVINIATKQVTEEEFKQPVLSNDELKEQLLSTLRPQRNMLLRITDFYMLSDVYGALTASQQKAIASYRQALRDLPATADLTKPLPDVGWPTPPKWLK